jgi:hypothetical protein
MAFGSPTNGRRLGYGWRLQGRLLNLFDDMTEFLNNHPWISLLALLIVCQCIYACACAFSRRKP